MAAAVSGERIRELVDMSGGEEALIENGRRYLENLKYLEAHREELTGRYPDEWIGVSGRRVCAHADTADGVVRMIEEAGRSLDGVVLQFMRTDDALWLL